MVFLIGAATLVICMEIDAAKREILKAVAARDRGATTVETKAEK